MATMTETPETATQIIPSHEYHAEADVLSGDLQRPIEHKIEPYAHTSLKGRRSGHHHRFSEQVSIDGLISFKTGHTRVSGSKSAKHDGWITLSTSVIESFNVFEVITADRIVSQVSTDHAYLNGHFPTVTFLGTQFNDLKVSGFPVELTFDFGICGDRPAGDKSYLGDTQFLTRVKDQTAKIATATGLPKALKDQYDKRLAQVEDLLAGKQGSSEPKLTCSLVQSIGKIPLPGVQSFGHVLVIPEFGIVSLGEVEVGEKVYAPGGRPNVYFKLNSIKTNLGCIGHGEVTGPTANANGHHVP
jgi:hypothetical protein